MNYKQSILGSSVAFILATSCCWLPWLIIAIGGVASLAGLSAKLEKFSGMFMLLGIGFLGFGFFQFYKKKNKNMKKTAILESIITCPKCNHKKEEIMPTDACQYFYECESCKTIFKPTGNDCCVYCSYGTVPCPPIQLDEACC